MFSMRACYCSCYCSQLTTLKMRKQGFVLALAESYLKRFYMRIGGSEEMLLA